MKKLNNYLISINRPCKEKYGAWSIQHRVLMKLISWSK